MSKFRLTRLFAAFSFLLIANCTCAQSITFNLADGKEITFSFNEKPILTHQDGYAVIYTNSELAEYPINEIVSIIKQDVSTVFDAPSAKDIRRGKNNISFKGFSSDDNVVLYTEDGKNITSCKIQDEGYTTIDLRSLPSGLYVVKLGHESFKFVKK